ncbi:MAG: sodium:proton antiporter [Clostridiales bacterium]|nr:cation:proton antiporter [Bacillota bacterium]MEE0516461.1 cation:proton antiporter [Anaerovoracaceae bacterium]PWL95287.1 MAG: sodium:proton antiporter [Clostridiales bacterium]
MGDYGFLVSVAIIMLSTKILGDLTKKVSMPQVVGALLAGVIIGPTGLGIIAETDFISYTAEIGVIMLMFLAGLDTDINEINRNKVACIVVACIGVAVPLIGGTACYYFFFEAGASDYLSILKAVFVGVVLTATSVSITVEALREMGKLEGKVGNVILGAAVIDDIIGIIVLTIVTSLKDNSISIGMVLLKILLYVIIMGILGYLITKNKKFIDKNLKKQRITTYIFASCLLVAFASEHFFGVADITGAYLLGLFLSNHEIKSEVARKVNVPSYLFFSPIFFASVGLKVELEGMTGSIIVFSLILLAVAIVTKIIGCGLGAKICGFGNREALQVGIGMVSRGEVALIVAQKGYSLGLLDSAIMPAVVLVVIATTILTPVILKKIM